MLNQLQKLFPSLVTRNDIDSESYNDFHWYILEQNTLIGIAKDELTTKDHTLLSTFLTPHNMLLPLPTDQEKNWLDLIQTKKMEEKPLRDRAFRFVHFTIQKSRIEPSSFKEAIETIFQTKVPILWESDHEGVIIEEFSPTSEENLSYGQIIDTLMSDLYVKITFFVGETLTDYSDIGLQYNMVVKGAEIAFQYTQESVLTYIDIIPYLFIEGLDISKRNQLSKAVLKDSINDPDLLKTMETFMHCNLNISETAKKLFMHRNSLQYRIDKFHEITGIDVRQFQHAMTLFLVLKGE